MRKRLMKRLHEMLIEIVRANDPELDKLGVELVEIEKKLMAYKEKQKKKFDL